ncbi:MAG: hypothetical protein H0U10_12620 [Chloroflexia bacterium]|nr:hypothetical protein [Chloroflexia bacterium]
MPPPSHPAAGRPAADRDRDRDRDRHLRVGVSHPSGDPARHRTFEVRAAYRAGSGWVAHLAEENPNDQVLAAAVSLRGPDRAAAFPTAAACLGDAVAMLVRMVDGDAAAVG